MHLGPGGTFGAEAGAVEIAAKHINRQFVVLLIADVDFVTVMWKYSRTVTGAAVVVAVDNYSLAFPATPAYNPSSYFQLTPCCAWYKEADAAPVDEPKLF